MIEIVHHPDLVGTSRTIASFMDYDFMWCLSSDTRKILCFDTRTTPMKFVGESAAMDSEPLDMRDANGTPPLLWIICKDGTLRSFSLAAVPVQQSSINLQCINKSWFFHLGNSYPETLIFTGPPGTIITKTMDGVFHRAEGLVDNIIGAYTSVQASDDMRLYIFGARGHGRVLKLNSITGEMIAGVGTFQHPNVVDHVECYRIFSPKRLICVSYDRSFIMSFENEDEPTLIAGSTRMYPSQRPVAPRGNNTENWFIPAQIPLPLQDFPYGYRQSWASNISSLNASFPVFTPILANYVSMPGIGAMIRQNPWINEYGETVTNV